MSTQAHVGIVVVDLEKAMAELTASFGYEWKAPQVRTPGGTNLRVTFNTKAPFLELIQGQPGSAWDTSKGSHLQHIAYWTDEFEDDKKRLIAAGSALEREGVSPFGGAWSYHHNASGGFRIELCDTNGRKGWMDMWGMTEQDMETR
jgi:hypothetical protein